MVGFQYAKSMDLVLDFVPYPNYPFDEKTNNINSNLVNSILSAWKIKGTWRLYILDRIEGLRRQDDIEGGVKFLQGLIYHEGFNLFYNLVSRYLEKGFDVLSEHKIESDQNGINVNETIYVNSEREIVRISGISRLSDRTPKLDQFLQTSPYPVPVISFASTPEVNLESIVNVSKRAVIREWVVKDILENINKKKKKIRN